MSKQKPQVSYHLSRSFLFMFFFGAVFLSGTGVSSSVVPKHQGTVLAYASNTSRTGLLDATNSARTANGLSSLAINDQLNSSAQAKAEHMSANDYWAHDAPDGTSPWFFFERSGYAYIKAGENLAYGFTSSQDTINGWMNSASHKANMLGDYKDVGFGIAHSPNYQSKGEQTIVVAHYGSKSAPPAPAAPVKPSTPAPQSTQPQANPTSSPPSSTSTPQTPVSEQQPSETPQDSSDDAGSATAPPDKTESPGDEAVVSIPSDEHSFLGATRLVEGTAPASLLAGLTLVFIGTAGYATLHRRQFTHALASGEKFVIAHPLFDATVVSVVALILLSASYGSVR